MTMPRATAHVRRRLGRDRRPVPAWVAALIVALYIATILNIPFWRRVYAVVSPASAFDWLFLVAVLIAIAAIYNSALTLICVPRLFKPVVVILVLVSATVSYFMTEYGLLFDSAMMRNVVETDVREIGDLLSWKLAFSLLVFGIGPSLAILALPIRWDRPSAALKANAVSSLVSVVLLCGAVFLFSMNFLSVFRAHHEIRHALVPFNVVSAIERYVRRTARSTRTVAAFGRDARRSPIAHPIKSVTILVIGETARAANFSLNGYPRETNPKLATVRDLISFQDVQSCGTSTAVSLPCIFSGLGQAAQEADLAATQEGLLDVLQRAGLSVLWRENQSGCKGVCARVPTEDLSNDEADAGSPFGGHDEILLTDLPQRIAAMPGDGVIVLHMMGSHGPLYYKRYPASFEAFSPSCESNQFSRCSAQQVLNAYDNTIRYTDHVLEKLVSILRTVDRSGTATAMFFVSDHGESLGENGLYLHGLPYAIAPEVQKKVPMLLWLSPKLQASSRIEIDCLARKKSQPLSHDNVFHSMLGLMDVQSDVYRRGLDIFAGCRTDRQASEADR